MTTTRETLGSLRDELTAIQAKSEKTAHDLFRASQIAEEITRLGERSVRDDQAAMAAKRAERQAQNRILAEAHPVSETVGVPDAVDLGTALRTSGFRPGGPGILVPSAFALDTKEASLDVGTAVEDVSPRRFIAPALGLESRYLYPSLRVQAVEPDATGVVSFRQSARTLADPTTMVRDILATSTKPQSDTAAEVVTAELKQIANISSGTPNVLLSHDQLASWVNRDLVAAYRSAVDTHIVGELMAAGITGSGEGTNAFEKILYAQEEVRAAGYSSDLVVLSPADALVLQLLQLTGGDAYVFAQTPPRVVITPAVNDGKGFVADRDALGILFLSPLRVQAFDENAGQTNTSTVRAESNGLFLVQRPDAAAMIEAAS